MCAPSLAPQRKLCAYINAIYLHDLRFPLRFLMPIVKRIHDLLRQQERLELARL
ncbi:MAG: hypothetical protein ACI9T9_003011 [Oleiphilaceae bacterium]|jgi:hypothetical protein